MSNKQSRPTPSFADVRLFFLIGVLGAVAAFLLPIFYLRLLLSSRDRSSVGKRSAKGGGQTVAGAADHATELAPRDDDPFAVKTKDCPKVVEADNGTFRVV
jgi:hypothetical protein